MFPSMQRNAIWIAFLILVFGFSIWFVVKAGYDLIHYYQLSQQAPVKIEKWEVQEQDANKYAIQVSYSYEYDGKNYQGSGLFGERYPNPWAANRALEKFETQTWNVWLNPKTPEKATFDRKFPYRATISAVVLIGLAIYFICLGLYVGVKNEQRRK